MSARPRSRGAWRKLANAPFIKVEATKFTEIGYVGRDVEQMIRDLVEAGIGMVKTARRKDVEAQAHLNAEHACSMHWSAPMRPNRRATASAANCAAANSMPSEIEVQVADTGGRAEL